MTAVSQPSGTVTLVFSDIEGSTRLLEELGMDAYRDALAEHRRIVREAYARYSGYEVDYEGDAFFYAFSSASDAVSAVSEAMAGLEEGPIAIRVGIHTGEPGLDPPKYVGMDVHFAARVMSSAHGGQVVLSPSTAKLIDGVLVELGEHRLKDIENAIALFQLGEGSFPPLKTISNTNLPRPASSFLGREAELREVVSRIEAGARLVTLTGPGGTGKTRLALEAATSLVSEYKAGVFWIGLASLRDPALVTETIAQTLGAKDSLASHIAERELLLLLDNLEQVIEAASELASLLSECPNLTLLVTSRELLRIQGEVEYAVPPLASAEAVELFCARAQLEPSEEIAELCARLDSLPLAVELAAARTKALSPTQILERLSSRLDLLKGGRDADPRQLTLRATIQWSYELLSAEEQQLFARLSVFAGGCTLEAAEDVADADLDTLQSLVEKSLVRFTNERYWMLETIREFAGERLSESSENEMIQERHAVVFSRLAAEAAPHLVATDQRLWLDALDAEHDNLRRTLAWLDGDPTGQLTMAIALWRFWQTRNHLVEARRWLHPRPESLDGLEPEVAVRYLVAASRFAWKQGDVATSISPARVAYDTAVELEDEALLALAGENLGLALSFDDPALGEPLLRDSVDRLRAIGDDVGLASVLNNLANVLREQDDLASAADAAAESAELYRAAGNASGLAFALHTLGYVHLCAGSYGQALVELEEALRQFRALDDTSGAGSVLEGLGHVAEARDRLEDAVVFWSAGTAMREQAGLEIEVTERILRDEALPRVASRLSREAFESAWVEGAALSPDAATERALAFCEHERP